MLVKIVYQNDTQGEVAPYCLEELIQSRRIKKFLRSDGWASVATAPIRGRRRRYEGPERRMASGKAAMLRCNSRDEPNVADSRYFALRNAEGGKDPMAGLNSGILDALPGRDDQAGIPCPRCGMQCREVEMLDGSSSGMTLLVKCTNVTCSSRFVITYDSLGVPEDIAPVSVKKIPARR